MEGAEFGRGNASVISLEVMKIGQESKIAKLKVCSRMKKRRVESDLGEEGGKKARREVKQKD